MRKYNLIYKYSILIVLLFSTTLLYSQEKDSTKRLSIGFEAGVQFTKIYDSWAFSSLPKSKTGFNMGLFADYQFSESFKTRIGLFYDNRGFYSQDVVSPLLITQDDSTYMSYGSYYSTDLDYTINYLTIPLSFFYVQGNDKWSFYLQGTIYYSLLISAHKSGNSNLFIDPNFIDNSENIDTQVPGISIADFNPGHTITEYTNEDVYDDFSTFDWGIQFGFGVSYSINPKLNLHITPVFTVAFADLYANPSRDSKWDNIYRINAGIAYRL